MNTIRSWVKQMQIESGKFITREDMKSRPIDGEEIGHRYLKYTVKFIYSFNVLVGLVCAAFTDWKLTVRRVISTISKQAFMYMSGLMSIR